MEVVKGRPYFCDVKEKMKQYPYLNKDISCDILIIGGGVIGAIANYYISKCFKTVLVDKSRFGFGGSSCSTALLEYILDDSSSELSKYLSPNEIAELYNLGRFGLAKLDKFIIQNGNHCHYNKRDVVMYSNLKADETEMKEEFEFLKKHGFKPEYLDENNNPFEFDIKCGLKLKDGGAEVNTYLLTKQMIEASENRKFENTEIASIEDNGDYIIATTNFRNTIKCKRVIFATGFNFDLFSDLPICDSYVTYSIVTNPILNFEWQNNALIQDFLEPYHYLRRLPDGRIIYGGEDTSIKFGNSIKDNLAKKKYNVLLKKLKTMFPSIANKLNIEYSFCGAFGSTRNNVGYIGKVTDKTYYYLSMGANGIVNAFATIDMIIDELKTGTENSKLKYFSPRRNEDIKKEAKY